MRMAWRSRAVLLMLSACAAAACGKSEPQGTSDSDTPSDQGTDSDTASETESGSDVDTGSDTGSKQDAGQDGGGTEECVVDGPNSMVMDVVTGLSDPVAQIVTVTFAGSEPALLDVSTDLGQVQADILDLYLQSQKPIYLRIDPGTRMIVEVLMPIEGQVVSLRPADMAVEVALMPSAAVHYLRRTNPCFDHLLQELETALAEQSDLLVTESEEQGIIDVRPL